MNLSKEQIATVIINIRKELERYIKSSGLKSLVIGESGGIDSALCTALAAPVCKKLGVKLIGRAITIETNKPDEIERGIAIGESFCDDFKEVDLTELYKQHLLFCEEEIKAEETDREIRIRLGNIKARLRMIHLYNLAQKYRGLVLSTDNYTEYLLGFWTLHGDVGDYGMIQELWKNEVYQCSVYLVENELKGEAKDALQSCIDAVPTDGLGITSSDLEQLEAKSYTEVDTILYNYINNPEYDVDMNHPVMRRHKASGYKRTNPLNLKRKDILK